MRSYIFFRKHAARSVAAGAAGVLLLTVGSAAGANAAESGPGRVELGRLHPQERGRLLSVTEVAALTPAQVQAAVVPFFGDTKRVRNGVTDYRITYSTVDSRGRATSASGLVVLP